MSTVDEAVMVAAIARDLEMLDDKADGAGARVLNALLALYAQDDVEEVEVEREDETCHACGGYTRRWSEEVDDYECTGCAE